MDTLVEGFSSSRNEFNYNHHSIPVPLDHHGYHNFTDSSFQLTIPNSSEASPTSGTSSDGDSPEVADYSDACLKFISDILMEEEELGNKPCMIQDCLALQAAEKSFYDLLGTSEPPPPLPCLVNQNQESPQDHYTTTFSNQGSGSSTAADKFVESNWIGNESNSVFGLTSHNNEYIQEPTLQQNLQSFDSSNGFHDSSVDGSFTAQFSQFQVPNSYSQSQTNLQFSGVEGEFTSFLPTENLVTYDLEPHTNTDTQTEEERRDHSPNGSRGKRNLHLEDINHVEEGRSSKQFASDYADLSEETEMFEKLFLCPNENPQSQGDWNSCSLLPEPGNGANKKLQQNRQPKTSNVGRPRGKKQGNKKEVVDLRTLLTQCAQAVSSTDTRTTNDLLNRIRQHSSPQGDGTERMAYYFANALEARLAGNGMPLFTGIASSIAKISAADTIKAYHMYISACPFKRMSFFYANRSIGKLIKKATRVHIIDFGILYGFQWPCLIQRLSRRPGGPPKLRITGIDFHQPGFRPAERVEETGRRLENYCKKFNVPFEYNAIAKKWHEIQLEELKIERDEMLIVNSLYRLKNIPDDTVSASSPRDTVLNLIKEINPDLFIHGALNGTYNAPFFVTRFREALFHFSALFDMFDVNVPSEDPQRMLFEKEVFGREVMNVVACEGSQRVERPETYKQWQVRNLRAGFRQVSLDKQLVKELRARVKMDYHDDFVVDEDSNWLLQGWKGRIILALSCWKPVQD